MSLLYVHPLQIYFHFSSSAFAGKSLCILIGIISSFSAQRFYSCWFVLTQSRCGNYFLFIGNRHHLPSSFIGAISRNSYSVITGKLPVLPAVLFLDDVEWLSLLMGVMCSSCHTEPVAPRPSCCSATGFN